MKLLLLSLCLGIFSGCDNSERCTASNRLAVELQWENEAWKKIAENKETYVRICQKYNKVYQQEDGNGFLMVSVYPPGKIICWFKGKAGYTDYYVFFDKIQRWYLETSK